MRRFLDFSIGQRLSAGFGLVLVVFAGLLGAMQRWQARSHEAEREYVQLTLPRLEAAALLEQATLTLAVEFRTYLFSPTPEEYERFQEALRRARTLLARLEVLPKEADGQVLFDALERHLVRYFEERERIAALNPVARLAEGREELVADEREAALAALRAFSDLQRGKGQRAVAAMERARGAMVRGTRVAAVAGLGVLFLLTLVVARSIQRPLAGLANVADALREGDWHPALDLAPPDTNGQPRAAPRDELRRLAFAFGSAAQVLERREARLRADHDVAAAASASLQREEIAELALRVIADHVNAEVGAVYVPTDDAPGTLEAGGLRPIALRAVAAEVAQLAAGEGLPGRAVAERRLVVARDLPADTPFSVRLGYDQAPPRAVAAVPLMFRRDVLGVMVLASLRDFGEPELAFLQAAAAQVGVGLQNVLSYERVERLLAEVEERNQVIQAQNEELQAQSEEIQAQNEELQAQGEELRAQNDQLAEQSEQLREQTEVLRQADTRKNEFLGILAHELRNPVAALSNSLHVLRQAGARGEPATRARAIMERQTRQLTRLIEDLLDVTRISRGKIVLQRDTVDLVRLVSEGLEDQRPVLEAAQVSLRTMLPSEPVMLHADRSRIAQILGNLVDNAVKFSGPGAQIDVEVRVLPETRQAALRVADTGVGIEPGVLPRLFEPFSQAATHPERYNAGLGLGLALVKALAELHGGTVAAHSDGPGHGAEFTVCLPLAESQDTVAPRAARQDRKRTTPSRSVLPRRILIIEDNADAAQSLRDALEFEGHVVHVAADARSGLALAASVRPDVVLCDIGLPELDGYQVAERLRADENLRHICLVAISGYATPVDVERAARAGFDRHLAKPAGFEQLNEILATIGPRAPV